MARVFTKLTSRLIFTLGVCIGAGPGMALTAKTLVVYGWPKPPLDEAKFDPSLADDPIFGRLACPSLTRLNLTEKKSEELLLDKLDVVSLPNGHQKWTFSLKPGLTWWSGKKVTTEDLNTYLQANLANLVAEKGIGKWSLPDFNTRVLKDQSVEIDWQYRPKFGPYIFNGESFWRKSSGSDVAYECVGAYKVKIEGEAVKFSASANESTPATIELREKSSPATSGAWLNFRFAKDFKAGNPVNETMATCPRMIDLPLLSVIIWNSQGKFTSDAGVRTALTQLTPRGELLRAGAKTMGDLLSGPILRAHPGYNRNLLVRDFDLDAAGNQLNRLGYKRPTAHGPRLDKSGKPLRLRLKVPANSSNTLTKVIVDSFAAQGIELALVNKDEKDIDGVVTGLILPWPSFDFADALHSSSKNHMPLLADNDSELNARLEAYALSLTNKAPDFSLLQKIHERLYNVEPFTILMQHRACIEAAKDFGQPLAKVIIRNPDWFLDMITNQAR